MAVFEFEVVEVQGYCPVYSVGDKLVVDGARLVLDNYSDLCNFALMSLRKKASSMDDCCDCEEQVRCMDKCAEFSTGGFVLFSCKRLEEAVF